MTSNQQGGSQASISVVLVNITGLFKDLLYAALEVDNTLQVSAAVTTTEELATLLDGSTPHVALVGAQGLARQGSALPYLQELATLAPSVRAVVIAPAMTREEVIAYLHEGARGLLCAWDSDTTVLTKCIRCVAHGQIWANTAQLELLIGSLSSSKTFKVTDVLGEALLSNREEQVLHLLADGMSNRELATALKLSEHTVKNHLFRIFDKLGVSNRMEAVLYLISQKGQKRSATVRTVAAEKGKPATEQTRSYSRIQ